MCLAQGHNTATRVTIFQYLTVFKNQSGYWLFDFFGNRFSVKLKRQLHHYRDPPRDFGEQGKKGIYFRGTVEQIPF